MNNKIVLINLLLAIFVLLEIWGVGVLWFSKKPELIPERTKAQKPVKFKPVQFSKVKQPPVSAYNDIPRYNLFSSGREEFVSETAAEPTAKPELKKPPVIEELNTSRITLFGVLIFDEFKKALVTDVEKTSERSSIWVQKGDLLDGFMIDSIEKDRIIVSKAGKKNAILLYDEKNPKKRERVPPKKGIDKKVIAPVSRQPVKSVQPPKTVVSPGEDDEYEIISTPFGEFKRKKRR